MSETGGKPPPFFCPRCGQKHRADLAVLEGRPGARVKTACRRCGVALRVRLEGLEPVCEVAEATAAAGSSPLLEVPGRPPVSPHIPAAPPPVPAAAPVARSTRKVPADPPPALPEVPPPPGALPRPEAPAFAPGDRVGRYTIRALLRRGASSTVYEADDPTVRRQVALKVARAGATPLEAECFQRQVDVQAHIRHPNVMPVYDRGTLEDGRPYFTMELLHRTRTLADLLEMRSTGALARDRHFAALADLGEMVERVLIPVAEGVYVANVESGVAHGDLRPENVILDGDTLRPYVSDFGRATSLLEFEEGSSYVRAAATPPISPWIAPEVAHGQVHPRTDLWGLGALLRAVATGRAPLAGSGEPLRAAARAGRVEPPGPDVPPGLSAVIRKALAPAPEERYVNPRQFAQDLRAWRRGGKVRAAEEYGGGATTPEQRRAVLRARVLAALWVLGGLAVGLLVGSQLELGGGEVADQQVREAESDVNRLDVEITALANLTSPLSPGDGSAVFLSLESRAREILDRLARLPASGARTAVEERVAYVRERARPTPVAVVAPPGVLLEVGTLGGGGGTRVEPGLLRLPPGLHEIRAGEGGRARFPVRVDFAARPPGAAPAAEAPVQVVIPVDPATVPPDRVLLSGGSVRPRDVPFAPPADPVTLAPFAMGRRPVSNAEWARFLATLPEADRGTRFPPAGVEVAPDGTPRPATGVEEEPVRGLRPVDVAAYLAWRSRRDGAPVRLPTEAEWVLASGAAIHPPAAGDLGGAAPANPYGVLGLSPPGREMVAADEVLEEDPGAVLAKGGGEPGMGGALAEGVPLDPAEPAEGVGFRVVHPLPAPPR